MNNPSESLMRQRRTRRIIYSAVGLLAIAPATYGLSRLKPDQPLEASAMSYPGHQGLPSQAGDQTEPEIISGLSPGDRVIVTDTSKWVSHERIRLK